jgi:hypothetical protein
MESDDTIPSPAAPRRGEGLMGVQSPVSPAPVAWGYGPTLKARPALGKSAVGTGPASRSSGVGKRVLST